MTVLDIISTARERCKQAGFTEAQTRNIIQCAKREALEHFNHNTLLKVPKRKLEELQEIYDAIIAYAIAHREALAERQPME